MTDTPKKNRYYARTTSEISPVYGLPAYYVEVWDRRNDRRAHAPRDFKTPEDARRYALWRLRELNAFPDIDEIVEYP